MPDMSCLLQAVETLQQFPNSFSISAAWWWLHIDFTIDLSMKICSGYIKLAEIEVKPCGNRGKNLERFETHDQGIEVSLVIIDS